MTPASNRRMERGVLRCGGGVNQLLTRSGASIAWYGMDPTANLRRGPVEFVTVSGFLTANCLQPPALTPLITSTSFLDLLIKPAPQFQTQRNTMAAAQVIPAGGTYIDTFKATFTKVPVDGTTSAISTAEFLEAVESLTTMFGSLPQTP